MTRAGHWQDKLHQLQLQLEAQESDASTANGEVVAEGTTSSSFLLVVARHRPSPPVTRSQLELE